MKESLHRLNYVGNSTESDVLSSLFTEITISYPYFLSYW